MIGLVYLAWAPLGLGPVRAFLQSYDAHSAGADHDLLVLLNGESATAGVASSAVPLTRGQLAAELDGRPHRVIALDRPVQDLAAYGLAAELLEYERLCFLNSYSELLADGWMGLMASAADMQAVGVVGATGSWESQAEWTRGGWSERAVQLRRLSASRRDYPRFPNPHIRTTGFMLDRSLVRAMNLTRAVDKRTAYLLESGWESITRQTEAAGLRPVVVGRNGTIYDIPDWPASRTFRTDEQSNLLIADNRTRTWQHAKPQIRAQLTRDAWGRKRDGVGRQMHLHTARRSSSNSPSIDTADLRSVTKSVDLVAHDAAIVIVNYRTPELVEDCVRSLTSGTERLSLEIVIVDNASGDGSVEQLNSSLPEATVVARPHNGGFAAGVNQGFSHTTADIVVVLNPDTVISGDALSRLLTHLRRQPEVGVTAPLLEGADGVLVSNGYKRFPNLLTIASDLCVPLGYLFAEAPRLHPYAISCAQLLAGAQPVHVCGAAMAIRRAAYEQSGPFDEGFFLYLEETEWQRRITEQGWTIDLTTTARARHLVRGGGDESLAPSPHFVTSALRYLQLQGIPTALSRAFLGLSLTCSWITLCAVSSLPAKRRTAKVQARAYRNLMTQAMRGGPRARHPQSSPADG